MTPNFDGVEHRPISSTWSRSIAAYGTKNHKKKKKRRRVIVFVYWMHKKICDNMQQIKWKRALSKVMLINVWSNLLNSSSTSRRGQKRSRICQKSCRRSKWWNDRRSRRENMAVMKSMKRTKEEKRERFEEGSREQRTFPFFRKTPIWRPLCLFSESPRAFCASFLCLRAFLASLLASSPRFLSLLALLASFPCFLSSLSLLALLASSPCLLCLLPLLACFA